MKNSTVFIALILILFSCKKFNKLTQFKMDYETEFTIPSSVGINLPFTVNSPDITSNSETTFESNNTKKKHIQHIYLNKLDLEISSPSSQNFDFLKTVKIYINANGLSELLLASKTNIPDSGAKLLALDVSGCDFQEYIKKDKFTLRIETITDQLITQDIKLISNSEFLVDAKVFA